DGRAYLGGIGVNGRGAPVVKLMAIMERAGVRVELAQVGERGGGVAPRGCVTRQAHFGGQQLLPRRADPAATTSARRDERHEKHNEQHPAHHGWTACWSVSKGPRSDAGKVEVGLDAAGLRGGPLDEPERVTTIPTTSAARNRAATRIESAHAR